LTLTQEYARARAGVAGMTEVGVLSVWERPTRIAVVAVFVGLAAWTPFGVDSWRWAAVGAWAALVLAVVGNIQVFSAIRRALR
ncbi:MAG: CDP-alcohol phosphatidyltransferase, partial [Actinomycetes bacterium]